MNNLKSEHIENILARNDELLQFERRVIKDFSNDKISMITYETLTRLTELKWYEVNDGIKFMPIDLSGEVLRYRTIIDNRFYRWWFGQQMHDCYEKCTVRKGILVDRKDGFEYEVGKDLYFNPEEAHNPGGAPNMITDIWVEFSRTPFLK